MKYKKGGFGIWVAIIIAVFLIGIVTFISSKSIFSSVTSIFEPLKKLVGIETSKAEASTNTQDCTIKRYYWSTNKVRIGNTVYIVIEGSGNCDGKQVLIEAYGTYYKDVSLPPTQITKVEIIQIDGTTQEFKGNIIKRELLIENPQSYRITSAYFKFKFGSYEESSNNLEITQ